MRSKAMILLREQTVVEPLWRVLHHVRVRALQQSSYLA
jgi:hypothetical protein